MPPIVAIDLFCGVGGLTRGLEKAGVCVRAGFDIDPESKYPYETNNEAKFILQDIRGVTGDQLVGLYGDAPIRLLAGCAPCQPFSTYSRASRKHERHEDWGLLTEFGRLVAEVNPDLITMENVPSLVTQPVFRDFCDKLAEYNVWHDIVEMARLGVPQTRKRLVLLASRLGPVKLSVRQSQQTVRQAIGHLPAIRAGVALATDPLHIAPRLSDLNLRRIRASEPGGTWRDWTPELRAACHVRTAGATYPSVYGRMTWEEQAPTITTQCFGYGSGRFGHPEQDRAISLREAAILQTFPEDYHFVEPGKPVRFSVLGRLIGNAVPVKLGEAIGKTVKQHVSQFQPQ